MLSEIKKSILAGIMIAVGSSAYLSARTCDLMWLGAILFATGLFTICQYGFNLYTGKVGYIAYDFKDKNYIGLVVLVCIFNLLTTFILGIAIAYVYPKIGAEAFTVYVPKLNLSLLKIFISASFCGLLMFLSVDTWKNGKMIGCFLYVPAFIFAGFDHSIANSFYCGAAFGHTLFAENSFLQNEFSNFALFSIQNILLVIFTVLGNAFGGMIIPLLTKNFCKNEEKTV